jgi:branched-chain amino acid transport system permease protein
MMTRFESEPSMTDRLFLGLKSPMVITVIISLAAAALATFDKGTYVLLNTIVIGGMWALMAMGLTLMFSVMNIPFFAYGEFFMIGTLTAYFIFTPIGNYLSGHANAFLTLVAPLIAILGAAFVGGVTGGITERVVFFQLRKRTREQWLLNCFVLTVGLSVILINGHQLVFGTDFKGIVNFWDVPSVPFFGVSISVERIFAFFLAMGTISVFWIFLKFSKTGRAIRAVSEDESGALMVGIDYNRIQTLTMALSCGLAALAGGTLLFMFPSTPTVGIAPLYYSWFVIIVVGMGNIAGAAVGGFVVALIQVLTRVYVGEGLEFVVPSAFMIVILVFKPSGIFGSEVRGIWDR